MQSVICQRCSKRPATTHLTEVATSGARVELHLCATCIQQLGLHLEAGPPPIAAILAQPATSAPTTVSDPDAPTVPAQGDCPHCGLPFSDFESGKRFGCALDYTTWEGPVATLLTSYHGTDRHVGRRPGTGNGSSQERSLRRAGLDAELRAAVASEDYAQAARLRDELRQLEQP